MPLRKGRSSATVKGNIHELVQSGYKPKQAVAIALHTAHPKRKKK